VLIVKIKIIFSTNSCRERVAGMGILKFEIEQIEEKTFWKNLMMKGLMDFFLVAFPILVSYSFFVDLSRTGSWKDIDEVDRFRSFGIDHSIIF
jgi:hypothetical protein